MPFVLAQFGRQFRLVAEHGIINERDTAYPIAFRQVAVGLQIVLPSCEVPHEVAPIHEVHLVAEEESQVLAEGGAILCLLLSAVVIAHAFALHLCPLFVCLHMARLRGVHAREEHHELVHEDIGSLVSGYYIAVFLSLHFRCGSILCMPLFLHGNTHITFHLQFHGGVVGLSVEERTVAVLLTVEVVFQREDIIGRVLVHRRLCRGADNQSRITAVADENNRYHECSRVEQPCGHHLLLPKQQPDQCCRYQHSHPPFLEQECCSRERKRADEGYYLRRSDTIGVRIRMLSGEPNSHAQGNDSQHNIHCQSGIERTSEPVNEQQLKPTCHRREARDDTVEDERQDSHRCQEGHAYAFPREGIATEIAYQHDSGDGQQVQQVDTDRQAHQVGDKYQPFIRACLVCLLVPLEDKPEHNRGE